MASLDNITLEPITHENLHAVLSLSVSEEQKRFYPRSNAYSIAEGSHPPDEDEVCMRAICKAQIPVGFMMTSEAPARGEYFLWRMMVDSRSQGQSIGAQGLELLIHRIKATGNAKVLLLSHHQDNIAAAHFYASRGFQATGDTLGAKDIMLTLNFTP